MFHSRTTVAVIMVQPLSSSHMNYTSRCTQVLYLDADAVVVHTRSYDWLRALVASAPQDGLVVSREAEGPSELIYRGERESLTRWNK
jgi:penicillin V acylase-like amidase (Ntn superfamily)